MGVSGCLGVSDVEACAHISDAPEAYSVQWGGGEAKGVASKQNVEATPYSRRLQSQIGIGAILLLLCLVW